MKMMGEYYSEDIEESLLGAILSKELVINEIPEIKPDHFYHEKNQTIFKEILLMKGSGKPIDVVLLADRLKKNGKYESVGGGYYITGLLEVCPAPSRAKYYGNELIDYWKKRQKWTLGTKLSRGDEIDFEREISKINGEPQLANLPIFKGVRIDRERLTTATYSYLDLAKDTTDAPDEFILMSILTHWAGLIGYKIKYGDLRPNIWTILFGKSSEIRKSTALSVGGKPFNNIQLKFDQGYDEAVKIYKSNLREWKNLPKDEKKDIPKPDLPIHIKLILDVDFSDAGFYEMLKNNPLAGTIVTAEFADFNYKLKRDMTGMGNAFLTAYDGDRMSRITRTHGTEIIGNPAFSILGATTTGNFKNVFTATETENGLLQRIFPVFLLEPTKPRKLYLDRKTMDKDHLKLFETMAMNWFRYDGEIEAVLTDEIRDSFSEWEKKFITEPKANHVTDISPHLERMVPGCLKLAMILESMERETPPDTLIISQQALDCSIMITENLFLPSLVYLLENEIIFDKNIYNENQVEKAIKEAPGGILDRSSLSRKMRSMKPYQLDEIIDSLIEKEIIESNKEQIKREQGGGSNKGIYQWVG